MPRLPDNPDEVRMSLGEHLNELRRRIIFSIIAVAVCMGICLFFVRPLVQFLAQPVYNAVYQVEMEARQHAVEVNTPAGATPAKVAPIAPGEPLLVVLTPMEAFSTGIKAALLAGFVIASPYVFYQLWLFIAAGLYPHERRLIHVYVPFSVGLFLAGAAFCYTFVLRFGLPIVLNFANLAYDMAKPTIRLSAAINFVITMCLVMGACFQTPLVMMGLTRLGLVKPEFYTKYWRHSIVIIFIVAAVITPTPDMFNQCAVAVPMMLLYWLGVLLAKMAAKKRAAAQAAAEASND
jgi:sec-independent protein translocase protein TatC